MLRIRVLAPDDRDRLEAFLGPRIDSSIFLLSNSRRAGLVDSGERLEGTYLAAFEDRRIAGVLAHYWNGNLVLQAPAHLAALLAAARSAAKRPVRGVIGPGDQVARAMEILGIAGSEVQVDEEEGLYRLELEALAVPEGLRSGRLRGRRIEPRDLERVVAWRVAYSVELLREEDTPELRDRCRSDVEESLARGETWVLEDGGRPVATTSFNAALDEVVQVGGVWTPPEYRGRGYGRAVVAASLLDARDESVGRAVLFTGDDNVAAIKAYAALGFRRIGDYRILLLR